MILGNLGSAPRFDYIFYAAAISLLAVAARSFRRGLADSASRMAAIITAAILAGCAASQFLTARSFANTSPGYVATAHIGPSILLCAAGAACSAVFAILCTSMSRRKGDRS